MNVYLDLTNPEKSHFKFKISKFPDGQQTIDIINTEDLIRLASPITILSRFSSFKDLELIICATQALKELGAKDLYLYVPYFLGSRSDRKFQRGGINYIKMVIAPIINLQGYASVTTFDPHSDVLEACITNYKKIDNKVLVQHFLKDINFDYDSRDTITIISPDAGAEKKVYEITEYYSLPNLLIGHKHRDVISGKITHTSITGIEGARTDKFVIIDDICDGGRTFIELAKVIKASHPGAKIYLIVSHGIFSNGLYDLSKLFTKIYTTNSIRDLEVADFSDYTVPEDFVNQLKIPEIYQL